MPTYLYENQTSGERRELCHSILLEPSSPQVKKLLGTGKWRRVPHPEASGLFLFGNIRTGRMESNWISDQRSQLAAFGDQNAMPEGKRIDWRDKAYKETFCEKPKKGIRRSARETISKLSREEIRQSVAALPKAGKKK